MKFLLFVAVFLLLGAVIASALRKPVSFSLHHQPSAQSLTAQADAAIKRYASNAAWSDPSIIPVVGAVAIYGEYFVKVGLGTPPAELQLQIDTGSTDLLVYGVGCDGCPPESDRFNWKQSSSAQPQSCKTRAGDSLTCSGCYQSKWCAFDDGYGDGSDVTGFVLSDAFTFLATGQTSKTLLGSIQHSTSNFEPLVVDGIFGLAYPSTSSWGGTSPLIDFMTQNKYYSAFSLCLHNDTGSSMTVGLNAHQNSNINWTARVGDKYYAIHLDTAFVAGNRLKLSSDQLNGKYGALVDSGTTLIILPTDFMAAFRAAVEAVCSQYPLPGVCKMPQGKSIFDGKCFLMTPNDIAHFPTFGVQPASMSEPLTITSTQYLVHQGNALCMGVVGSKEKATILGDTFMRGFYVIFDQAASQVGFASQIQCPIV